MTYQEEIKEWLTNYKKKHFSGIPDGRWKKNQQLYPHILPESHQFENLLSPYRELFKSSKFVSEIKFHPYFHHMNSSQAMCINMFYPLIIEEKLELITQLLNMPTEKIDYKSVCFEKVSEIEGNRRPTSFDFYFKTKNGKEVHFEIKYTEQEFGKAKKDLEHIEKYQSIYKHHKSSINEKYCNQDSFLDNYQLMRNLINVGNDKYIVFIYPENNRKIKSQVETAKSDFVKQKFKRNVFNITWEELIVFIELHDKNSTKLNMQIQEFKEKYKFLKPSSQHTV